MRRFFFLQNSPVDCFVKPKELTELETGRSQFVRAGVQRVQPFVHGYRECNTPVQVKGGSLAQLSGVSPLSTGYYLTQKAARNQLRCPSPLSGKSKRRNLDVASIFNEKSSFHERKSGDQYECNEG